MEKETAEAEVNFQRIAEVLQMLTIHGGNGICSRQQSTVYQLAVRNYDLSTSGGKLVKQVTVILRTAYTDETAVTRNAAIQVADRVEAT